GLAHEPARARRHSSRLGETFPSLVGWTSPGSSVLSEVQPTRLGKVSPTPLLPPRRDLPQPRRLDLAEHTAAGRRTAAHPPPPRPSPHPTPKRDWSPDVCPPDLGAPTSRRRADATPPASARPSPASSAGPR